MNQLRPHQDYFYPLSPRLSALLATIFTQGGAEDMALVEMLPDDDVFSLQDKAEALLELEGEARAHLVAQHLRKLLQFAGVSGLESIDASWLLAALRGEHPQTIGLITSQMSSVLRDRILRGLPEGVRPHIPDPKQLEHVPIEIMRRARQAFESTFVPMPPPPSEPGLFYFKDIILMEARDLVQLVFALGIEELAAVFASVGRRKLAELCSRLGEKTAQELLTTVKDIPKEDIPEIDSANAFLAKMLTALRTDDGAPSSKDEFEHELLTRAGLFRLAKAVHRERPSFVQQLSQRLPRTHGRVLKSYALQLAKSAIAPEELQRTQDQVLLRLERLAERGKVNPSFLNFDFCYWGGSQD